MQFLLNGKPCISPSVLLSTCEQNDIDTSEWLGKANSFVDRHGVDPSYGYFLVDNALRLEIVAITDDPNEGGTGNYTVTGGSNKADLTIVFTDGAPDRTINDLYLRSIINVTPSLSGDQSIYLVKLEDARFVFGCPDASKYAKRYDTDYQWYNKVVTYLTPSQLKAEFELDEEPEFGHFIYEAYSVEDFHQGNGKVKIGTKNGADVKIDAPLEWTDLFTAILNMFADGTRANIDPVFPYFEPNNYTLHIIFPEDTFPLWVPQDICLKFTSARDVLYQLLFWIGASIKYDGLGVFTIFKTENKATTINNQPSTELDDYLFGLSNPFDIKHPTIETISHEVPNSLGIHFPILDIERTDNDRNEYHVISRALDNVEAPPNLFTGRTSYPVTLPITWIEERGKLYNSGDIKKLPDAEYYYGYLMEWFQDVFMALFSRYPSKTKDYGGFLSLGFRPYLDRVSWYSLGGMPGTKIESKLPVDWEALKPSPIIPRELKLSIIRAKVNSDTPADAVTFEFKEPKLIIGQLFDTSTAYNTIKRSYDEDEEVILVGGSFDSWRKASSAVPENYAGSELYFTIDDVPFLRLKVNKSDLEELSSGAWKWRVLTEDVALVNGKIPRVDDETTIDDYIYIKNSPEILLDDSDTFIYIAYDTLAGHDVYHKWSVADAQNDILFLKGLPGYVQNPVEPTGENRRLVLKSPYSGTEPIGWLEEAADGRTDQELEEFVIQVINEQGGSGGGGGGSTFILKGLINNANGYASTDATVNWDTGTVLVSDGSAQPTAGTADNTFNTPFLDNEPVLLIKKNNGMWTVVKIQFNLIRANVNRVNGTDSGVTDFPIDGIVSVVGTAPAGTVTAANDGKEYDDNEELLFFHGNDNKWHTHDRELTALFRTTSTIGAGSWNGTQLVAGTGNARRLRLVPGSTNTYNWDASSTVIKNMATAVTTNKLIQCKRIGKFWFVDVENCG